MVMPAVLAAARSMIDAGERGLMATAISGDRVGSCGLLDRSARLLVGDPMPDGVADAVAPTLASGLPSVIESSDTSWFVEPVVPAPSLLVFGAVAVADALVPMALAAGYLVHVVDTRDWLASPARYPGAASVSCGLPIDSLRRIGVDGATSVVSLLHEARLEDVVLRAALEGGARYVGSMGSRLTTEAKRARLADSGVAPELLARLRAPIGLAIGGRTPQEIAVSILAEVVAVGRGVALP
jgi:xanthine dehydrogenase accessory factor